MNFLKNNGLVLLIGFIGMQIGFGVWEHFTGLPVSECEKSMIFLVNSIILTSMGWIK